MKKSAEKNGATAAAAGGKVETSKTGEEMTNGTSEILAEVSSLCNEVWVGKKKVDSTFFDTKFDAQRLKLACDNGKAGEVMSQLLVFTHNDPSSAGLVARLKAAMAAQAHTVAAGTSVKHVKADLRPNMENVGQQQDPVSKAAPLSEQHPADGNDEDAADRKQADKTDKQCDAGNKEKGDDPKLGDKGSGSDHVVGPTAAEPAAAGAQPATDNTETPPAAKPAGGKNRRGVKRPSDDDSNIESPLFPDDEDPASNADVMPKADKAVRANAPTAQGDNDAIKAHGDGNQATAHAEGAAPNLLESPTITGIELIDIDSIETDPEAASIFDRSPAVVEAIRDSMKRMGFKPYRPIKVWDHGNGKYTPSDGNTRVDVAREHGDIRKVPAIKVKYASREEFIRDTYDEQLERRNMSTKDKFAVVRHYYPLEAEKARKRHGGQSAKNPADSKGRADEVVGAKIGCSAETVSKMRFLIEADNKELLEKVFNEEVSISAAFTMLKPKKGKLPDADKSDGSKSKLGPEAKKPIVAEEAADANEGTKAPEAQGANPPCSITTAADPKSVSTAKETADVKLDAKPDVKVLEMEKVQINQTAPPPTPPAIPVNNTQRFLPASERLLAGLLAMAHKDSKQKVYGLMNGCPTETRDFIKTYFSGGAVDPTKLKPQSRSNPAIEVALKMTSRSNAKKGATMKTGKHKAGAGK